MICRHCLHPIVLSSTEAWRLAWNPDDDAAPYECTEHAGGHQPPTWAGAAIDHGEARLPIPDDAR